MVTSRAATAAALAAAVAAEAAAGCGPVMGGATFAAGMLVGLPHGAADHVLPAWSAGRGPGRRSLLRVGGAYAAGTVAALTALLTAPIAALAAALAVSAWHFGTDDAFEAGVDPTGGGWRRAGVAAGYGLAPVLGPLAWWPDAAGRLLGWLAPGLSWGPGAAHMAGGAVALAALAAVVAAGRGRRAAVAAELAVVVAATVLLPPLAAFGLYFGCWHAPRHVARVLRMDPCGGPTAARLGHLAAPAWPAAVAAYAALALGWWVLPARDRAPAALLGLLAVATPHAAVVAAARRRVASRRLRADRRHRPGRPRPFGGPTRPGPLREPVATLARCSGPTDEPAGDRHPSGPSGPSGLAGSGHRRAG